MENTNNETNEFLKKAKDFLKKTNTTFKAEFLKYDYHFLDEKEKRDIYKITLKRGKREYIFNFGQSINASGEYISLRTNEKIPTQLSKNGIPLKRQSNYFLYANTIKNKNFEIPNEYDVLASVTSYDVGTFKDFCLDFGYSEDSIKAEKIYKAVLDEYNNIKMLFTDEEILILQEIQ